VTWPLCRLAGCACRRARSDRQQEGKGELDRRSAPSHPRKSYVNGILCQIWRTSGNSFLHAEVFFDGGDAIAKRFDFLVWRTSPFEAIELAFDVDEFLLDFYRVRTRCARISPKAFSSNFATRSGIF
jgi:hypothetical protein